MHYVEEAATTFSHRRPIHHGELDPPKARERLIYLTAAAIELLTFFNSWIHFMDAATWRQ